MFLSKQENHDGPILLIRVLSSKDLQWREIPNIKVCQMNMKTEIPQLLLR